MGLANMPTEQQEAERLAAYLRIKGYPFTHIPNETGGDPAARRRAIRMKRAGVSRGFPDYIIIKGGRLIVIELKRRKGGRATPEQRKWLDEFARIGARVAICNGADEAIEFIEKS